MNVLFHADIIQWIYNLFYALYLDDMHKESFLCKPYTSRFMIPVHIKNENSKYSRFLPPFTVRIYQMNDIGVTYRDQTNPPFGRFPSFFELLLACYSPEFGRFSLHFG